MNTPDYVQNTYSRTLSDGLPGSFSDANPVHVSSFIAESLEIPFGRVISVGSSYGPPAQAILGGGTVAATPGTMTGSDTVAPITTFQAIADGGITFTIDGAAVALTALDFSACTTNAAVAAVITTALGTKGTCTFSQLTQCFVITSATTGANSSVSAVDAPATGTSIVDVLGFGGTPICVAGAAERTAVILGVTVRSVTVEGGPRNRSNESVVVEGDVGAVLQDGGCKVQTMEAASANGDVYFDNVTGQIFATAGAGRTKLATAKFKANAEAGEIVNIDITGIR